MAVKSRKRKIIRCPEAKMYRVVGVGEAIFYGVVGAVVAAFVFNLLRLKTAGDQNG